MLSPHDLLQLLLGVVLVGLLMTLAHKRLSAKPQSLPVAPYTTAKAPETRPLSDSTKELFPVPTLQGKEEMKPPSLVTTQVEDIESNAAIQSFDAFLVVDVEATCYPGTDFNYANEIIASCLDHTHFDLFLMHCL